MPRTGTFGGFAFDPEVFAEYMAERPTWNNAIIASGILRDDPTLMELIGTRGNVATLPFYKAISVDDYAPLNNDGDTDNTPQTIAGSKQTAMLIQRMKAWKVQDFTKELTGANPMQHIANSVGNYYDQVWERELMNILNAVMKLDGMSEHIYDVTEIGDGRVDETSLIYAQQKALGDASESFGLVIMHSLVYARYKALGLVDYNKYTINNALVSDIELPTIGGLIPLVSDRYTVDTSGDTAKYITTIVGAGAILTAAKTNYEEPYYTDYDPETNAGVEKLYTKQGRILHPNGFSLNVAAIEKESPTFAELGDSANWNIAFDHKNIKIGQIISYGAPQNTETP